MPANDAFTAGVRPGGLTSSTEIRLLLCYLAKAYPQVLEQRYKMTGLDEVAEDGYAMLELLGRKRGMLISGGEVNLERAAITLLDEFRSGKLGRITLELPEEA